MVNAAYVRVSSRSQDHANAAARRRTGRRCSRRQDRGLVLRQDDGRRAGAPRPDRLRADARAGLLRRLYLFKLDRLTRSGIADTLNVVQELRDSGVEIVTVADGFSLDGQRRK